MKCRVSVSVLVVLAFALTACRDVTAPVDPEESAPEPSLAISDGAHAGNDHFFFLPPMVPSPGPSGTFDGSLSPEVQVCVWDGSVCATTLAIFNVNAGPGSETVRVSPADEHYIVNWHTGEILDNYTLGVGETFRVRVIVQGQELGFADLTVVGSAKELKNVNTDEFVALKEGRTLPIKFRIEEGALAQGAVGEIVSAGFAHSCAVDSGGTAYCWGFNVNGELGNGVAGGTFNTPQPVTGGLTWQSVQTSSQHTCGLTTDGQMYCWGRNTIGQLGIGAVDFVTHPVPELVVGGHTFQSLASFGNPASFSSCAVTTSADMYCWGFNSSGQLGTGAASFIESTPQLVIGGHSFAGMAAMARRETCALTIAGDILCWGLNDNGQLGQAPATGLSVPHATPTVVPGGQTFESVTVGGGFACGINTSKAALCWGRSTEGQLGIAPQGIVFGPTLVTGGHTFRQLSAGHHFTCGVTTDGDGLCWGENHLGQLGRGFTGGIQPTPGLVVGSHTFQSIGGGFVYACGVTISADTFCWGFNGLGQLGNGSFISTATPVFAIDLEP